MQRGPELVMMTEEEEETAVKVPGALAAVVTMDQPQVPGELPLNIAMTRVGRRLPLTRKMQRVHQQIQGKNNQPSGKSSQRIPMKWKSTEPPGMPSTNPGAAHALLDEEEKGHTEPGQAHPDLWKYSV